MDVAASYDAIAAHVGGTDDEVPPIDRALLALFAELVLANGAGRVADVGCGLGPLTAHLRELGVDAFGVDLSPAMVAAARDRYPGLEFTRGTMTALDVADGALGGILASHSIVHTPPRELPGVFAEFHRVLAPGAYVLLAFTVRDAMVSVREWFGQPVALDFQSLPPDLVVAALADASLPVLARVLREPDDGEQAPRAYVLARKSVRSAV